ncbi:MAG: hypothetical protein GTO03_14040, partial [Planctomycetales bacterium]|nr:hypothetical protein [Planctomycetales bacterium]
QVARADPDTVSGDNVVDLDWRPGGAELAMGMSSRVKVIAAPDYREVAAYSAGNGWHVAAWSPAGDRIAVASATHLALWERGGQKPLWKVALRDKPFESNASQIAWEPGGERISYSSPGIPLSLYSAREGSHLRQWKTLGEYHTWHPRGGQLAFQSSDRRVTVTDADSGETLEDRAGWKSGHGLTSLAWHPNGNILATAREGDFMIELWEMPGGKNIAQFSGGSSRIFSLAWSPDG